MNNIIAALFLVCGLWVLWKSAELLVDGAVSLAQRLGVSSLVIGLTVVAMGTSAPEVAASIAAAVRGAGDIAIGNVYGSNIANLALVGGLAALINPITVKKTTLLREIPAMLLVALVLWPILDDLRLSRLEGALLLLIFLLMLILTVLTTKKNNKMIISRETNVSPQKKLSLRKNIIFIVAGLIGLGLGAEITVRAAVFLGEKIGLSQAVIGLTIIAVGTSLPELVTCVVASLKKQDDISIGNLVGSNIFNTLLVTGIAGTVSPFSINARLIGADYWIMIGISAGFALAIIVGRRVINRLEALLLVGCYFGYITYLLIFNR
jgi:cation:H+ antiporter